MRKLDYIDSIRGLAILAVILVHTSQYGNTNIPSFINKIVNQGARGVQLFYLASAFTLFLSFKNRSPFEKFPVKNFFIRRFFRIAPMYYLGILYYIAQNGLGPRYWLGNETQITILNIFSNFTFLHGFNPYWITSLVPGGWSIGVEMTFYSVLPFLFYKIKNLNQAFNFFLISIFAKFILEYFFIKFNLISDIRLWHEYLFLYFPSQLPIFSLGIILHFIINEKENIFCISGKSILIFCLLLIAQLATKTGFIFPNHILFGLAFLILVFALSTYKCKLIVNPIIIHIGKVSFSMYLVHFAVLHWLTYYKLIDYFQNGILNFVTRYVIVTVLTILISNILFRLVETPFQEIGKKIILKLEKK